MLDQDISCRRLSQNFRNQEGLLRVIQKIYEIDDVDNLEFYLHQVIQVKTSDFASQSWDNIVSNTRFMILLEILDELILRDSFNAINEFCKSKKLTQKLKSQDWYHVVKFLRDYLTHGRVEVRYFPEKEWSQSHSKYGFIINYDNIIQSKMPKFPKRKRPYLKFIKDMKKFVKELNCENNK